MPTRRQFLLASSALGMPLASLLPLPATGERSFRLGLLQAREPFVDCRDPLGSRERAFSALRVLLQRSFDERGPFDWIACSAYPSSGPLAGRLPESFALTADSDEYRWLRRFASRHAARVSLTAWHRDDFCDAAPTLLAFESDGRTSHKPICGGYLPAGNRGLALDTGLRPGSDAALADHCRRLGLYGAGIAVCRGPSLPPGSPAAHLTSTRLIGPDGRVQAQLPPGVEGCLAVAL